MTNEITNFVTGDAAFSVDRRGVIVSWNSGAEKIFSHMAGTALGLKCWKLLSGRDIYGNRYCCERCPLMQMASHHESVHSFQVLFKTASNGRKEFTVNCLTVFSDSGEGLLLHICKCSDQPLEYSDTSQAVTRPSANNQRDVLTNREREVLALLAEGKTTREITLLMCISQATVRNHIQHMLYKLHVHNRLEAVVAGRRLDIV